MATALPSPSFSFTSNSSTSSTHSPFTTTTTTTRSLATVAAILPPLGGPPSIALPPLPHSRPRKGSGNPPPSVRRRDPAMLSPSSLPSPPLHTPPAARPVSVNRTPSGSQLPTPSSRLSTLRLPSTPTPTPTLVEASADAVAAAADGPPRDIRRMVSLTAFPHPPNSPRRLSSLPTSPLSAGAVTASAPRSNAGPLASRAGAVDAASPMALPHQPRSKRPRGLVEGYNNLAASSSTPTLLNGSGDGKSISGGPGTRASDGLSSLHSPPLSRCSSAQGSDSTTATTLDDLGDAVARGRDAPAEVGAVVEDRPAGGSKGNVVVSVRVRPDANGDHGKADGEWMVDGRRALVAYRGREGGSYFYDHVFTPHDQNAKVYDACAKRLVRRVMEGYHGTVFAYGMTGTGKTFTMQGTATSLGVIPLAITDIFSYIRETPHREFLLRVSYLEIYNEKIHDLLSVPTPSGTGTGGLAQQEEIKLREDSKRGVYATPLKEEIVQSPTQLLRVIARGDLVRRTSSTQFNARSSRSHAVVQIVVESRERAAAHRSSERDRSALLPGGVRVSTLSLIDLAGSERAAESKERRQEGAHINKSLLTLGTVIARLSGDKDKGGASADRDGRHLPYRDSKLTRLLQPALSGNSLISILCTIQVGSGGSVVAAAGHTAETLNTLKFASRAKNNIVSHAKKAEEASASGSGDAASRALLDRYRMEIQELRGQLENQAREKREVEETAKEKEAVQRHEEQMLEMQLARTALKERIEHLNRLILCSKSTGVNTSSAFLSLGAYPPGAGRIRTSISPVRSSSAWSASAVGPGPDTLARTASARSASTIGTLPAHVPGSLRGEHSPDDEDSTGEYGDGTASLSAQVRALQADLADKNRYISTLEKRLLQARRSSHSRTSFGLSPTRTLTGIFGEESEATTLLREKDNEIADLRARLDDKDRMMTALRSAARKRDVADRGSDRRQDSPGSERSPMMDSASALLDEMIQDQMDHGHLTKGSRPSLERAHDPNVDVTAASHA